MNLKKHPMWKEFSEWARVNKISTSDKNKKIWESYFGAFSFGCIVGANAVLIKAGADADNIPNPMSLCPKESKYPYYAAGYREGRNEFVTFVGPCPTVEDTLECTPDKSGRIAYVIKFEEGEDEQDLPSYTLLYKWSLSKQKWEEL